MTAHLEDVRARRRLALVVLEAALVLAILGAYVTYVAPTLDRPLLEKHGFRQTQTAYTARIFHEQGIDLLHPRLPVFGEPYEAPFEFPLFQAAASVVMDVGVADDTAMRLTGLACFVLTALLLYGLVRHVAGRASAVAALVAFVLTPFSLLWGRTSMIEYLATAGGVGFAWATIAWRESRRPVPGALALVAGCVGLLVKPTTAVFWIVPAFAYRTESTSPLRSRRAVRAWTSVLVAVPLVAAFLWTRHADAIKAASPATAWLTSGELQEWNFGTLDQRLDLDSWDIIASRLVPDVLGAGFVFLFVAAYATARSRHRRFWLGIWFAAVAPMLVFTNLYVTHDYYLAAVTPAFAALVGLGACALWSLLPRRPLVLAAAGVLALALVYGSLEQGRSYWLRIHGGADEAHVLPLAAQIGAHTSDDDRVAIVGLDWSPAVLYYAHRWGHMVTTSTHDVAYDLIHGDGYRHLLATELDSTQVVELDRWRYVGALDRNLYALADDGRDLPKASFLTTDVEPAAALGERATSVPCDRPFSLSAGPEGTWLRFSPASPGDRIQVSDELAPLSVRRYVWVGPELAMDGRLRLTCTGTAALTLEAVGEGGSPGGQR